MADASPDKVRIRFIVDNDTPELLKRLADSKRRSHEIVYLLRLGLQLEMRLNGKVPMAGHASAERAPPSNQAPAPAAPVPAPVSGTSTPADIPFGGDFAELTGLDADYFAGAPSAYSD